MVDFNNEATVSTAPHDLIKILYLERRKYVIDAIEFITEQEAKNIKPNLSVLKSRVKALFLELEPALIRYYKKKPEQLNILYSAVESKEAKDLMRAFSIINVWFDEKRLTMIDTIEKIDTSKVELENRSKNL